MANPVESKVELIAQDIVTTLKSIRRSGGYWNDIDEFSVDREGIPLENILTATMPHMLFMIADESVDEIVFPRRSTSRLRVYVDGTIEDADDYTRDKTRERAIADIRKAVQVDTERGGNARFTLVEAVQRFDGVTGHPTISMFRVELMIEYAHEWAQP